MKSKLTPLSKFLIVAVILGGLGFAATKFIPKEKLEELKETVENNNKEKNKESNNNSGDGQTINIGVVTWGGYAGGQYFNKGFDANTESRFYKDYGFKVNFQVLDDFDASRSAWKNGEVDLLWATTGAFTTEVKGLEEFKPQVVFQADWSRGGDAIVVRRGINSVSELRGKKVAFAELTPSHTFLLWMLDAGGLSINDIKLVKVASAIDAAAMFKSGQADAAVVWSPDDADCVAKVSGSKVLQSTKGASNIIADVFIAKKDYINANKEKLKNLARGWFIGAAEINNDENAKKEAAAILASGLGMPEEFCFDAINNTRLCTLGDNLNFFGLNGSYKGVTGENIYLKMEQKFKKEGMIKGSIQGWRQVANSSIISSLNDLKSASGQEAEGQKAFTEVTEDVKKKEAISTKQVSIQFASGQYKLDDNMKTIIELQFLDIAKSFAAARIRIEGNTDNTGGRAANVTISQKRAQAVADFLINDHGFDKNRFIIKGNGPDKPVAKNSTESGRSKNRRTDFELVAD